MLSRTRTRVLPRLSVPTEASISVYPAFLAGSVIFLFLLKDPAESLLSTLSAKPESLGAALIIGCVFLISAAYICSVSLAGRLGVPLLSLVCGGFLSAVSGVIMPLCITQKKLFSVAAIFTAAYIFVSLFLLVSARSVMLSRELNERCASDKRIRKHFLLLTALMLGSAIIILLLFLLLSGLIKDIFIR